MNLSKTLPAGSKVVVIIPSPNGNKRYDINIEEQTPIYIGHFDALIQKQKPVKVSPKRRKKQRISESNYIAMIIGILIIFVIALSYIF